MRPIKLTMQAFGSYGKHTEIDFTKPEQNLFLVTGDTGSGKTTIFDALVFALYGEASSETNKKDGYELQSHYASQKTEPFVELTFTENEGGSPELYTVKRIPRHIRPAMKKGAKDQNVKESVTLTLPDGSDYAQSTGEINKKLVELTGLTKSQFMQVAMIAQGEFMDGLRAGTAEKKVIFQKLFNTELYKKITDELDNRRKNMNTELAKIFTACQTEISHVQVPEEYENHSGLETLVKQIVRADRMNAVDMELLLEELEKLGILLQGQVKLSREEYENVAAVRDTLQKKCEAARNILKAYGQLETAKAELLQCESLADEMKEAGVRRERILTAYEIREVWEKLAIARKETADVQHGIASNEELLPKLKESACEAGARERKAYAQLEEENNHFSKESERVKKSLEILKELQEADALCREKEKALDAAVKDEGNKKNALSLLKVEAENWGKESEQLSDTDSRMEQWRARADKLKALGTELTECRRKQQKNLADRKAEEAAKLAYELAKTEARKKNDRYLNAQEAFLDAQAGILAREKLEEGKPCPVCGSLHHPSPCTLADEHRDITRELLDQLAGESERAVGNQEEKAAKAAAAAKAREASDKAYQEQLDRLQKGMAAVAGADSTEMTPEGCERLLKKLQAESRSTERELSEKAERLRWLRGQLEKAESRRKELEEQAEAAAKKTMTASSEAAAAEEKKKTLMGQKDYPTETAARAALAEAKGKRDEKETSYKELRRESERQNGKVEQTAALIAAYKKNLPIRKEAEEAMETAYRKILTEKEMTEEQWKEIARAWQKSEAQRLERKLQEYRDKKQKAEAVADSARKLIGKSEKPDTEALTASYEEAEERRLAAERRKNRWTELEQNNHKVYENLSKTMESRMALAREASKIDTLWSILAGKRTGARMDLETYAQRYYLSRILDAANIRFRDMTAGQFELRMVDIEKAGEGKNRGLDLMVYSTVTGKEREVRTLSGGESFMAALSMALGMADQIQAGSASVNLDMMFIDEGFGSLDENAQKQAIRVLQQMAGGSRLIGIISHVAELKQQIEDQLCVSRDENGSTAVWKLS